MPEQGPSSGKIKVKIITPLFPVMEEEADSVLLPAVEGDILILPNRAPLFLALKEGRMILYKKGEEARTYLISKGICEIRRNICPVLAWGGEKSKINPEMIAAHLEKAEKALENSTHSLAHNEVAARIDFFKMILKELNYQPEKHRESIRKALKNTRMNAQMFGAGAGEKK